MLTMTTIEAQEKGSFHDALAASGRSAEIPDSADAYGWLVGSWELEVCHYHGTDLLARRVKGEVHFAWVLEGALSRTCGSILHGRSAPRTRTRRATHTGPRSASGTHRFRLGV